LSNGLESVVLVGAQKLSLHRRKRLERGFIGVDTLIRGQRLKVEDQVLSIRRLDNRSLSGGFRNLDT